MIDRLWDESISYSVREGLGPVVPILNRLTHLGDGPLLIVAAIAIYWFGAAESRRKRAFVIAVGTAAFALAAGLKGMFQLPRPLVSFSPGFYPGYTFPSAHAMGSAAFYGSLAVTMQAGKPWQRYLAAGTIIAVVSLSRVTLGVHFLGDVIVGAGLGLLLVWIGLKWRRGGTFRPGVVFVLAGVIAVVTVLLGSREYVPLVIGAGFGGAVGWWWAVDHETSENGSAILVTGVGIVAAIAILRTATGFLGSPVPGGAGWLLFVAEMIAYGILTFLVMIVPVLAVTIEDRPYIRRLQRALPFRRRRVDLDAIDVDT